MRRFPLLLLSICAFGAGATDWVEIPAPASVRLELDRDSILREGDTVRVWDRATFQSDQVHGSGDVSWRSRKTLVSYDCAGRTTVPLARIFYGEDGSELMRLSLEGVELPRPAVPDSSRARMLELACKHPAQVAAASKAPAAAGPAIAARAGSGQARRGTRGATGAVPKAPEVPAKGKAPETPVAGKSPPAVADKSRPEHETPSAPGHENAAPKHVHWSYTGARDGVAQWHKLSPDFRQCAEGRRQSPIDIRGGVKLQLEGIKFDYKPSPLKIVDNGHTVQVNYAPGSTLLVGGKSYELQQFHFHKPAEERVNGRVFEMVAHLVHKSRDDRLAVVAVLFIAGIDHPVIQSLWNNLPIEEEREDVLPAVKIDAKELLPKSRGYYTYIGSLTTPPCTEGVQWIVLKTPVQVSREQMAVFAKLHDRNSRPTQAANGRLIKESL
jgi:carbonic anhydrase